MEIIKIASKAWYKLLYRFTCPLIFSEIYSGVVPAP